MKHISFFLSLLLCLCAMRTAAQDTVRYGDPNYFFIPHCQELWAAAGVSCELPNGDTAFYPGIDIIFQNYVLPDCWVAVECYADAPLEVYGIALPLSSTNSCNFKFVLMKKDNNGNKVIMLDSVNMHRPVTDKYYLFEGPNPWRPTDTAIAVPLYEGFFDSPVVVSGSFFVGIKQSPDTSRCDHLPAPPCYWHYNDPCTIWARYVPRHDTCYYHSDILFGSGDSILPNSGPSGSWNAAFPILTPGTAYVDTPHCPRVTGFHMYAQQGTFAGFQWESSYTARRYQVSCGPQDSLPDANPMQVTSDTVSFWRTLDTTIHRYAAYVREECHHDCNAHDTIMWGDWSSPVYFYLGDTATHDTNHTGGDTTAIATPEAPAVLLLAPNPADNRVSLSSPYPLTAITVTDPQGRTVLRRAASGLSASFSVRRWPSGIYVVSATTAHGQLSAKLSVQ